MTRAPQGSAPGPARRKDVVSQRSQHDVRRAGRIGHGRGERAPELGHHRGGGLVDVAAGESPRPWQIVGARAGSSLYPGGPHDAHSETSEEKVAAG
ncbi:hypothetical protein [Candidatus Nitronereus thalassa]|uniref:Uncharacterized protein n=1 Tax=Candidatus Nitronereus thalassa TaxID=3020898 RepID=A0ABU3K399_9BACT|nr:hypothetical protein [Candidatus Nitronereus thalassa]MDT7040853.1 hypothetical protein [Candidatus Nitronereus thalassa]